VLALLGCLLLVVVHADPNGIPDQIVAAAQRVKENLKDKLNPKSHKPPQAKLPQSKVFHAEPHHHVVKVEEPPKVLHADPKELAAAAVKLFGDADGSAFFIKSSVVSNSIAEVPTPDDKKVIEKYAKQNKAANPSFFDKARSFLKNRAPATAAKAPVPGAPVPATAPQVPGAPVVPARAVKASSSSSSSSGSGSGSQVDSKTFGPGASFEEHKVRMSRPVFSFKKVAPGADSVVIRKHGFKAEHHKLLAGFSNSHPDIQTIVVVDAFVGPEGRRHKHAHKAGRKRGHKKSPVNIAGVKFHNLFVFTDTGIQLFPSTHTRSRSHHFHHRSHHKRHHHESSSKESKREQQSKQSKQETTHGKHSNRAARQKNPKDSKDSH